MLTKDENELVTRMGPGTPCGDLLRRYWQPICFAQELTAARPVKRVKMLGEELVLFRDSAGGYGLLAEHCSHRGTSLSYGFIEDGGLRCAYHGWLYDAAGRCLEQPFEPGQSMMKHTIRHPAYPVQELAGLLWTYMGPGPAPLLPRWDVLLREDGERRFEVRPLECNWLQAMENTPDFVHTYYLHGHNLHVRGIPGGEYFYRTFERYGFKPFEWGVLKFWTYGGPHPESGWGHPLIFPNMQRALEGRGAAMHWRVPQDDTHTNIFVCMFTPSKNGEPVSQPGEPTVEYFEPLRRPDGEYELTSFPSQDHMAWETQGPIVDRGAEHVAASDMGVVMFRSMLIEQIEVVRRGDDPIGLIRDPGSNEMVRVIVREDGLPPDLDGVSWVEPNMGARS